jgi:hypothetical protein
MKSVHFHVFFNHDSCLFYFFYMMNTIRYSRDSYRRPNMRGTVGRRAVACTSLWRSGVSAGHIGTRPDWRTGTERLHWQGSSLCTAASGKQSPGGNKPSHALRRVPGWMGWSAVVWSVPFSPKQYPSHPAACRKADSCSPKNSIMKCDARSVRA